MYGTARVGKIQARCRSLAHRVLLARKALLVLLESRVKKEIRVSLVNRVRMANRVLRVLLVLKALRVRTARVFRFSATTTLLKSCLRRTRQVIRVTAIS
jgi:hypothetical protein